MPAPIVGFTELEKAGRLGNQLWQIASTVGLAKTRRCRPLFPHEWSYRNFYRCPDSWFGVIPPRAVQAQNLATGIDRRARIYLQDLGLWTNATTEIRNAFAPSEAAAIVVDEEWERAFDPLPHPIVAVHVRRGDYATNPVDTLTSLPVRWYLDALDSIELAESVVMFSDDIPWCREQFGSKVDLYYEGVPRPKEWEPEYADAPVLDWLDIFLMARCDEHVISNSSYSWWGAWMSENPQPRYPSRWFGSSLASYIDFRKMIPPRWVEVKVHE